MVVLLGVHTMSILHTTAPRTRYHYHANGSLPPILELQNNPWVFVFGSNIQGIHGGGAALKAYKAYGARMGVGVGQEGFSYGIPTKDQNHETKELETMSLKRIEQYANMACRYMAHRIENAHQRYWFTAIGTGFAGLAHEQIAPMFRQFEKFNVDGIRVEDHLSFPDEWFEYLEPKAHHEHELQTLLFKGDHQTMTSSEAKAYEEALNQQT